MENINDAGLHTAPLPQGATQRDMPGHKLTITQAKQVFISFGVPRSTRSIQRFCENGSIDCIRVRGEKIERYFISQPSAERYALELKQLERISHIEDDVSRHDTSRRDAARHDATSHGEPIPAVASTATATQDDPPVFSARIDVLEKENFQLKIDRSAKEQVIGHMMEERQVFLAQLTDQSREIGRLETHLQQLSAPQRDMSRYDATCLDTTVVAPKGEEKIDPVDVERFSTSDPGSVSEHPTRSVWAKFFG